MTSDLKEITVAADIGGTNMRAALISNDGEVLLKRVLPTPHDAKVPSELMDLVRSVANEVTKENAVASHVVMGLPGQIDYRSGNLLWAPNLPESWPAQLSENNLTEVIGLPVRLANDADVAAVGEAYFGAGREFNDVAYITISTGIGTGFVFGGRLLRGDRSLGELGHTIIDWEGWVAHLPSTLEEMASGTGLTRMAAAAGLSSLPGEKIDELDKSGDAEAIRIWESAITCASVGIFNLTMAFSPSVIVLGGGLGLQPNFFKSVRATVERRAPAHLPAVSLVQAGLGDSAGLVGAARWAAAFS